MVKDSIEKTLKEKKKKKKGSKLSEKELARLMNDKSKSKMPFRHGCSHSGVY